MLITSQIVNLKRIGEVLVLMKYHQCSASLSVCGNFPDYQEKFDPSR